MRSASIFCHFRSGTDWVHLQANDRLTSIVALVLLRCVLAMCVHITLNRESFDYHSCHEQIGYEHAGRKRIKA
jgi:hypothetical protein